VTKAGRDAMFTEGIQPDDRLVWTVATNDNFNCLRHDFD
jgi:hypothetical protein